MRIFGSTKSPEKIRFRQSNSGNSRGIRKNETGKSGTQYIMEKRADVTLIFKYSDFGKLRDPKLYDTVKPIQTIAKKKK